MIDRDLKFPPLNDYELSLLFDATQQAAPEIHAEFLERLQNQALGLSHGRSNLKLHLRDYYRFGGSLTL